jgi:hypothetical protein
MSRTIYGNLTGAAARSEWADFREQMDNANTTRKQNVMATCERIARAITPEQYLTWLETTSDTNSIFNAQADAMLEQVRLAHGLADSVTLNWQAAFLILDMAEGTDNSPVISGGEILELGTITNDVEIPF